MTSELIARDRLLCLEVSYYLVERELPTKGSNRLCWYKHCRMISGFRGRGGNSSCKILSQATPWI